MRVNCISESKTIWQPFAILSSPGIPHLLRNTCYVMHVGYRRDEKKKKENPDCTALASERKYGN